MEPEALTPPYFNIAEKRKVTVNATCGENVPSGERFCKLVGYDRLEIEDHFEVLDGQVSKGVDSESMNRNRTRTRETKAESLVLYCTMYIVVVVHYCIIS